MSQTVPLKGIGFWKNGECHRYPQPQWLVQHGWHTEDLDRIVAYLRSGNEYLSEMGYSYCRFANCSDKCADKNGVSSFTDGEWMWPEGLAHYIEKHSVILPEEFISTMQSNHWQVPASAGLLPATPWERPVRSSSIRFWLRWARKYSPWYYRLIFW
jgi:hypothetical protein